MGSGAWGPPKFGTRSPSRLWPAGFLGPAFGLCLQVGEEDDELPAAVGHRDEWALRTDERASVECGGHCVAPREGDGCGQRGAVIAVVAVVPLPCTFTSVRISGSQREPGHGSDKPSRPTSSGKPNSSGGVPATSAAANSRSEPAWRTRRPGRSPCRSPASPADAAARLRARVRFLARLISVVSFTAACAGGTRPMVAAGATVRLPTPGHAVLRNPLGCMAVTLRSDAPRHNVPQPQC